MSYSKTCQYDLEDIAQLFPSLEHLQVDCISDTERLKSYLERGSRRELSTSLGKLTALKTLKIDLYPKKGTMTNDLYNDIAASLGPGKVLSVAQLPNLHKVEVPLCMFARTGLSGLEGISAIPGEVLPRSLKTLVLLDSCSTVDICLKGMVNDLEYLESFGDDLSRLPHLESVAYCPCYRISELLTTVRRSDDDETYEKSILYRLPLIRTLFSKQNVQFLLQERYNRRTIDLEDLEG